MVKAHTLVGVQYPPRAVVIQLRQHGYRPLSKNVVTCQKQMAVNTVLPEHSPKLFLWNLIVCFLEVDKTCVNIFGILCQTCLLEGEALVCCAAPRAKTVLGGILLQLWFNYFAASFSGTSHTLYQQG